MLTGCFLPVIGLQLSTHKLILKALKSGSVPFYGSVSKIMVLALFIMVLPIAPNNAFLCKLVVDWYIIFYLTLSPPNELVKMLYECQRAWIQMRCRVTRHLIRIQAVCIWQFGRERQDKGLK